MPSLQIISASEPVRQRSNQGPEVSLDLRNIEQSVTSGILESAQLLAEIKQNNPSQAQAFLSELQRSIKYGGLSVLSNLGKAARAIATNYELLTKQHMDRPIIVSDAHRVQAAHVAAPRGFLWKPVADSPPHGLVILLPSNWSGLVSRVSVLDHFGRELAIGQDSGIANGDRQHFRFNKAGSSFPDEALVKIAFKDGLERVIRIPNASNRYEGK